MRLRTRGNRSLAGLVAAALAMGCGDAKTQSRSQSATESSDDVQARNMTVEDVVSGFELGDSLPLQEVSDADREQWEASLVPESSLRPSEGPLLTIDSFALDDVTGDVAGDPTREVVDLRPNDTGIRNQGSEGTCTAFATVAALENLVSRFYKQKVDVSERHHWTTYANYQSTTSLQKASAGPIVSEADWPYYGNRPSSTQGRGLAKVDSYGTTSLRLQPVLAAVRSGEPVVIAVGVLSSMMNPRQGGIIQGGSASGGAGHALAVTGVIVDERVPGGGYFIVKNSWGPNWGDKGYGYVAFDYCDRTWCSAFNVKSATLFANGQPLPKDNSPQPVTPVNPTPPPGPSPAPVQPVNPLPPTPPGDVISDADFSLEGVQSRRRGLLGVTAYHLIVKADPDVLAKVAMIRYPTPRGRFSYVRNGQAADIPQSADNLASPDFRTRQTSVETDGVVIFLRNGKTVELSGVRFSLN